MKWRIYFDIHSDVHDMSFYEPSIEDAIEHDRGMYAKSEIEYIVLGPLEFLSINSRGIWRFKSDGVQTKIRTSTVKFR